MAMSVDAKLLKQTKFPPEFNQKVDMKKVNVEVMKKWIAGKISEILGSEDDVVIELCFNLLEGARFPDIKVLQIQLTGFLDKDTAKFCKELWTLCLSAQSNPQGVPKELLEAKKLELIQEKIDAEKAAEDAQKKKEQEKARDKNIDNLRQRERGERGRGRGRGDRMDRGDRGDRGDGGDRGDRGDRDDRGDRGNRGARDRQDYNSRPRRDSRSPPPRRRSPPRRSEYRALPSRRETDTYIPGGRDGYRADERRHRSPSPRWSPSRSPSRSRTPPRYQRPRDDDPRRSGRRRYAPSRSPTPIRRGSDRDRGRRNPGRGDHRARSFTPSDTSRSRSPRRYRRRRSPSISSRSPTPPRRQRDIRRRRTSPSPSRSRSRSLGKDRRRSGRSRRSLSHTIDEAGDTRADYNKERRHLDERRDSRSRTRERDTKPTVTAPSRTPSTDKRRDRKRHRSIQRYAPAARRRRNTSSVSSPTDKRRKTADSSGDEGTRQAPEPIKSANPEDTTNAPAKSQENRSGVLTASELRERLLREKVMALRKSSGVTKDPNSNGASLKKAAT